ncbi:2-amino-4-hydroxy-6-hydroxymethyldihydropteridine diphosphokinase [Enterovibrio norvegicus FF-33]|uniref:2-amino-4-hydroxy-6- hydroxymethyldihydropteridine diphosphokinase n=1 Tax=Enterovibrio TaxID=188143 RepID=UPI0002E30C3E|nr:2-amino-4-hydroxy-6-hydroxymethyldihydropteridine diphosphokinase [Enterovibrio norvegicus]OEE70900.1 2-amino-4-hydroxy-6-hydroxymethyldihydropteridine diphosphokinase [Enterovibrio norvegicus FF-33]OEE75010.1 2-amino-4-hydroxy-6-hydroxymethyldihydropteridine diphosphokinase [Enterovibrio norvegicus FF-162]
MIQVLVSVGSNIEREHHIAEGMAALKTLDPNCRSSRIFEAVPVGFEGPNFYNLVVELHTDLSLEDIMAALREIESRWGRERDAIKFRDRTLDIDLLTYGELSQPSGPVLPRKDVYKFAFTLWPLAELCPDQVIPGDTQTYQQAWDAFSDEQPLWPVTDFSL